MRNHLIKLLLLLFLPVFAQAQSLEVKKSLSVMVKEISDKADMKSISIAPNKMTPTSINIEKIDGKGICDPTIKPKVEKLAKMFSKHRHIRSVMSIYGVYVKKENGKVLYLPGTTDQVKQMVRDCKNLYVSVY